MHRDIDITTIVQMKREFEDDSYAERAAHRISGSHPEQAEQE
jgi:hypothetical protein